MFRRYDPNYRKNENENPDCSKAPWSHPAHHSHQNNHHYPPPLYNIHGQANASEPSYAEMLILSEKIQEYEMMVGAGPGSNTGGGHHRQGCPSVASNASLARSTTEGGGLMGNHVPFGRGGANVIASNGFGCKGKLSQAIL